MQAPEGRIRSMITCNNCSTPNSLDSAFCKHCGQTVPPDALQAGKAQLNAMLAEGYDLFDKARTDEADFIAERCLATDPSCLRALSLKGMILERRGLFAEALDAYEQVLASDPESALDKIKVNQIRNLLAAGRVAKVRTNRRPALFGAAAACVFVVALGALAAALANRPATRDSKVATAELQPNYSATPFDLREPEPPLAAGQQGTASPSGIERAESATAEREAEPQLPAAPTGELPRPAEDGGNKPVNPLPPGMEIKPIESATQVVAGTTQPNPDPEPGSVAAGSQSPKPEEPKAVVDIRLSEDTGTAKTGASMNANGVEALVRTARGQYQVGNYQAAAATYERALKAGADAASVNQRLAQCYEQLGRRSDAIEAYNRAVVAMERAIDSGKGGDRLRAALDSSKQALKVLQGG